VGITPQQGLRLRGTDAEERGLPTADDATVLAAMVADPILIERPLVETDKGVRLCRPQDKVLEIL
jgi:arsenate reductase (glutaredoxin)